MKEEFHKTVMNMKDGKATEINSMSMELLPLQWNLRICVKT